MQSFGQYLREVDDDDDTHGVTATKLREMLREARYVFGGVVWTRDDVAYIELKKGSVREALRGSSRTSRYLATLREDGDLYIG